MSHIKFLTSDNVVFNVEVEIVKCSGTIKSMLENCPLEDSENSVVPLSNVNSVILCKVLEWAKYHKDDPEPLEVDDNEKLTDNISPWDVEFLKVDQGTLFELVVVANFLDIKALLDIICKTIANMIKVKTPEEIRKTFNIKNDFSPDEERLLLKAWANES